METPKLTNKEIADNLLSDFQAYQENIKDMIVGYLTLNKNSATYWDAWFRGANNSNLEKAEKGIVYNPKKELYKYGMLKNNTPELCLKQESTIEPNEFKNTRYGLIEKVCYSDGTEAINCIMYSDDLEECVNKLKTYPSWYNYVNGFTMNLQGYVSEINIG